MRLFDGLEVMQNPQLCDEVLTIYAEDSHGRPYLSTRVDPWLSFFLQVRWLNAGCNRGALLSIVDGGCRFLGSSFSRIVQRQIQVREWLSWLSIRRFLFVSTRNVQYEGQ